MSTPRTIVKQTSSKAIHRRPETTPPLPADTGRSVGDADSFDITPDRVRLRAYEIVLARNGAPGDAASDWAQAELELHGRVGHASSARRTIADPSVPGARTRVEGPRQPATRARGGL